MPVTNIKFFNRNGSGPETATSVESASVVSTIYNSGSSASPTLLGEFFISNSSDSGYDISASLRLGERSTLNFVTASLISASATNITESATGFIFARRYPGTQLTPVTDYTIKAVNLDIKSNGLKMVSQSNAWIAATLLNTNTSGVISNIASINNGSVYWDGTKWVYFNFSNTTVPYVLKTGELNQVLPASKGGTSFTDLFSTSRNNILVGGGTQMSLTGSLSPSNSGSMVISNGTVWNSIKTSSLQFTAETSSYLKPLDFDGVSIAFKSSSNLHSVNISSLLETTEFEIFSKNNINITSSYMTIDAKQEKISLSAGSIDLNSRLIQVKNYKQTNSNTTVDLNKPIQIIYRTTGNVTASLSRGLNDNQILTFAIPFSDRYPVYLTCSSDTGFASPELSSGYLVTTATQLRYDAALNKWFRHF